MSDSEVGEGAVDITPDDSVAPVYLDASIDVEVPAIPTPDELIDADAADRESGITALVALGLTRAQAVAIAGG